MKNTKEKIAYLQGLSQGLDVNESSREGKVLSGIILVLDDLAEQIEDIEIAQEDLEDYVESIDEELYDLEGDLLGHEDLIEEDLVEVVCPKCEETVCFEADIVDDEDLIEVICPNCDEVVYINDQDLIEGMGVVKGNSFAVERRMSLTGRVEDDI
ncbi:CD1247 N-terminal domain-containing protein [Phosphitispora sp. TUW77]|uniref:CD1247 N-terminal domain-containing protein n=1 Tax=Phosphitispora sp. TUW77 TaxID=3152361 RepID=UPI003AB728FB